MIDISVKGNEYDQPPFEVEKGKIREFAKAIGDNNPVFRDMNAAAKQGFKTLGVPPTFGTVLTLNGKVWDIVAELKLDFAKVLHSGQEYEYFKSIEPGETLFGKTKIADITEKSGKSGKMQFIVLETTYNDKSGDKVFIDRMTLAVRE